MRERKEIEERAEEKGGGKEKKKEKERESGAAGPREKERKISADRGRSGACDAGDERSEVWRGSRRRRKP